MSFLKGFFFGLFTAIGLMAMAAQLIGVDGYLTGWEITKDGEEICSDPFVWKALKEIECD